MSLGDDSTSVFKTFQQEANKMWHQHRRTNPDTPVNMPSSWVFEVLVERVVQLEAQLAKVLVQS